MSADVPCVQFDLHRQAQLLMVALEVRCRALLAAAHARSVLHLAGD